jgi:DNA-binding Lrp family transcriptional regulator
MEHPREPPYIALNSGIGVLEAHILQRLYDEQDIATIAKGISDDLEKDIDEETIQNKIKEMRDSGVIKRIAPVLDPLKIWNHLYFVFIKSRLTPPLLGVDVQYPRSWKQLCDTILELIEVDKKLSKKIVRQMYGLQGTEWDIMLQVTTNDMGELRELCERIIDCGFIEKVWSFEPIKGAHHYFEPVGVPSVTEIKDGIDFMRGCFQE